MPASRLHLKFITIPLLARCGSSPRPRSKEDGASRKGKIKGTVRRFAYFPSSQGVIVAGGSLCDGDADAAPL